MGPLFNRDARESDSIEDILERTRERLNESKLAVVSACTLRQFSSFSNCRTRLGLSSEWLLPRHLAVVAAGSRKRRTGAGTRLERVRRIAIQLKGSTAQQHILQRLPINPPLASERDHTPANMSQVETESRAVGLRTFSVKASRLLLTAARSFLRRGDPYSRRLDELRRRCSLI